MELKFTRFDGYTILLRLHRTLMELISLRVFDGWMLAFCGLTWWKKPEYLVETTDLGQATTTLPHADAGTRAQAAAVTSDGVTPALSRPF